MNATLERTISAQILNVHRLYIAPGHSDFGRHGHGAAAHPIQEVETVECVAGRGLRGDRYFDHQENYKGQITFFSLEVFDELCGALKVEGVSPSRVRRNVFTRDVDLNELIGKDFEIQGVRFHGTEE